MREGREERKDKWIKEGRDAEHVFYFENCSHHRKQVCTWWAGKPDGLGPFWGTVAGRPTKTSRKAAKASRNAT